MAEPDTNQWKNKRLAHWAPALWESSFRAAVSGLDLSGLAAELTLRPRAPDVEAWQQWADPLWFDLPNDMLEGSLLTVSCPRETINSLIALITGEEKLEPDRARGTYVEILSQAAGLFGRTASQPLGKTAQFPEVVDSSHPADAELGLEYVAEWGGSEYLFAFVPNAAAVQAMMSAGTDQATAERDSASGADPQPTNGKPATSTGKTPLSSGAQHNLAMLLHVELDLSVSFGTTHLNLQEVLKLASGSIVELNRSVAEPVDVLVNNCVIARGEVVVVDGNYGIRVTEIVSRQDRMRTIF